MKLIDILVDAGDETPLFGVHTKYLAMDPDGRVHGYCDMPSPTVLGWGIPDALYSTDGRGCLIQLDRDDVDGQWQSAIITREQYEAALAAKNEGWIEWSGGECPVEESVLVDVKFRDGSIHKAQRANYYEWGHVRPHFATTGCDIIAYRLHQPQKAEQPKADDEADLNECIGQGVAPDWNGEGVIPPVGCVCERSWAGDEWQPCKILFTSNQLVVVDLKESGREDSYNIGDVTFRPIHSEAERKRNMVIAQMMNFSAALSETTAGLIYDAIADGNIRGIKLED